MKEKENKLEEAGEVSEDVLGSQSQSRRAFVKKSLAAGIIAAQPTILAGLIRADGGGGGGTTTPWGTTMPQTTVPWGTTYQTTYGTTSPWGTTYQTTYPNTTYVTTQPPEFRIRALEVDFTTTIESGKQTWQDGQNSKVVRRTRTLSVTAPETEWGLTATCLMAVTLTEFAQVKTSADPAPESWREMDVNEYNRFNGGGPNQWDSTASITWAVGKHTGLVTTLSRKSRGSDGVLRDESDDDYDNTDPGNGFTLTYSWGQAASGADKLNISHGGGGVPGDTSPVTPDYEVKQVVTP